MNARVSLSLVAILLLLSGCAATRVAEVGPIGDGENLLTLMVTEDLALVRRECAGIPRVAGCFTSHMVEVSDGVMVKALKIVRYADSLPSLAALQRDADELCHAAAEFQHIADPCAPGSPNAVRLPRPGTPSAVTTR